MSRQPEQKLWDLLRPALRAAGLRAMRVENMLDDGFPDVVVQGARPSITFIETKARPDAPTKPGNLALGDKYGLRLSQRNWWLAYRLHNGRRGLVVSRVGTLIYAHDAALHDELNRMRFDDFCDCALAASTTQVAALAAGEDWS